MELAVHQNKILNAMSRFKSQEAERASDAGEMREEIGSLLKLTGLNKKAFSFVRAIDKMPEEKRDDVLRSLTPLLEMMDKHWNGQSTPDMLDAADEAPEPEPVSADDLEQFTPDDDDTDEVGEGAYEDEGFAEADAEFERGLRAV